jgi:hypothetical protein
MVNLSLDTAVERYRQPIDPTRVAVTGQNICIASFGNPVAEDYADFVKSGGGWRISLFDMRKPVNTITVTKSHSLVLFLKARLSQAEKQVVEQLLTDLSDTGARSVCIVSTFRVHLEDVTAKEAEQHAVRTARCVGLRATVLRPGHLLSDRSSLAAAVARWGSLYPLVPSRVRSCFVTGDALFAAIERERSNVAGRPRAHTLLGANVPWRRVLASHRSTGPFSSCLLILSWLMTLLMLGQTAMLLGLICRLSRTWPSVNVHTLRPRTFRELRALYSPYNFRHVKIVGYNNGVNHFGHRYPGRTIVSTVNLNRVVSSAQGLIRADCGATVRKARDVALRIGQDLPVIPNYSYVCLGTAFFVPIHGSASDYSCIAETITRAVLYDPSEDRLIVADRDDEEFGRFAYDTEAPVLLLRLYCRVKPKQSYFLRTQGMDAPAAGELIDALGDKTAANVEIRKPSASGTLVKIFRYYSQAADGSSPAMEIARDSIGRIWDRLEENSITSLLMHALTRHVAFHVELFFTPRQFERFWETHRGVPLKKIQLRYISADGLPNSPFRAQACVSADMFMFRWRRRAFEDYLGRTFGSGAVRANRGKHSC